MSIVQHSPATVRRALVGTALAVAALVPHATGGAQAVAPPAAARSAPGIARL